MYKTVRQGENSLQYHILPQDDQLYTTMTKRRRTSGQRHRTAFILVITLILGCAIVAAAVLIPALMASNVVNLPTRFQTFAVAASRGHGKYSLQGAQYIALLPVKDPLGHFNAYQLRPSLFTATTTTTTTTTSTPTTTDPTSFAGVRIENNDPHRPPNTTTSKTKGDLHLPRWIQTPYMPWVGQTSSALVLSLGVAIVLLLATASLGLCLFLRRRALNARRDVEQDKSTLLAEGSGDED